MNSMFAQTGTLRVGCQSGQNFRKHDGTRCTVYVFSFFPFIMNKSILEKSFEVILIIWARKTEVWKLKMLNPFLRDLNKNILKFISKMTNLKSIKSTKQNLAGYYKYLNYKTLC